MRGFPAALTREQCAATAGSLGCPCGAPGYHSRSIRCGAGARSRSHVGSGQHNSNTDDHHVLAAMPSNSLAGVPGADVLVEGRTGREHSLALTVHLWYRMVVLTEAGSGTNNQQPTAQAVCKIRATAGNPNVLGDQYITLRRVP